MLTPDEQARIDQIREREQAATAGPWDVGYMTWGVRHLERNCEYYDEIPEGYGFPGRQGCDGGSADGGFIAHSRADIPFLLALVERLQKRRAVACQECGGGYYGYCAACNGTGATWEDGE